MKVIQSAIVGQKFCEGSFAALFSHEADHVARRHLPAPDMVKLVREPDNEFDKNAVAVHVGGTKCGFVPRAQAERLAADLDAGKTVTATLSGSKLEIQIDAEQEQSVEEGGE